jgi:hypothetical protein
MIRRDSTTDINLPPSFVQKAGYNRGPIVAMGVILAILILGFAVYYFHASSVISAANSQISTLQADNQSLRTENSEMQAEIVSFKSQVASLEENNTSYKGQISSLQAEINSNKTQISTLTNDNLTLGKDNSAYKVQVTLLQNQASSLQSQTSSLQTQVTQSSAKLDSATKELALYKDTFGSVVASDVNPNADRVSLVNNSAAVNPTWNQLYNFIKSDQTDRKAYVLDSYDCKDFSRDVHNNAEKAGIRAAWVAIKFKGETIGHACNAFKTVDRGLVFIDCTGVEPGNNGLYSCDKSVAVKLGSAYQPAVMFSDPYWRVTWYPMGTVDDIRVYW